MKYDSKILKFTLQIHELLHLHAKLSLVFQKCIYSTKRFW